MDFSEINQVEKQIKQYLEEYLEEDTPEYNAAAVAYRGLLLWRQLRSEDGED